MSEDALLRMANQIAANFRHATEEEAVASIATHIRQFWTPRMRAETSALAEHDHGRFDRLVVLALERLASAKR